MVKRLINMLKKGFFLATAGLFLQGCPTPIPVPHSPNAIVSYAPIPVRAGENSTITVNGEDPDGDIVEYRLDIDEGNDGSIEYPITSNSPISISKTFNDEVVKIYGECTDSTGLKNGKTVYINPIQPTPEPTPNHAHLTGRLESNEEDGIPKAGEVKAYVDENGDGITDETLYDDGNFDFQVPLGSDVDIKGAIKDGETQKSYVRTVHLDDVAGDENLTLRAVPYPDFDGNGIPDNLNEFKTHMEEINISTVPGAEGLRKWNLDSGFEKIVIFTNYNGYSFTTEQIDIIKDKIKASNDIEKFVGGKGLDDYIEYGVDNGSMSLNNRIYVRPGNKNAYLPDYAGKTINKARIELDPNGIILDTENTAITHEFGHAFIAPNGEANILPDNLTIMNATPDGAIPKIADIKAEKIVNESTYNPGEKLNDILGIGF